MKPLLDAKGFAKFARHYNEETYRRLKLTFIERAPVTKGHGDDDQTQDFNPDSTYDEAFNLYSLLTKCKKQYFGVQTAITTLATQLRITSG